MIDDDLSLAQLAERAGIEARTIRSWIAQGLIAGPSTRGRGASYPPETLTRLLAIKALRDRYGMPLARIRQELMLASADAIRGWAREGEGLPPDAATPAPPAGSALDYLRALRASGLGEKGKPASPPVAASMGKPPFGKAPFMASEAPIPDAPMDGVDVLLRRLGGELAAMVPRKAKGDVWLRIAVTPDFELAVRGDLSPDQIARLERVADLMRHILLGRTE
jgi:DNA-binding transcriptional MerR regulator